MQRLCATEHGGERLQRHARDVVHGLLRGERNAGGLSVETHQPGALVFRAEPLFHYLRPDLARSAVFGDLLEKVVMGVEEEAEARAEFVDVETATARPLDVLDSIVEREGQLLQRGGTGFADVVSADGDGVEARGVAGTELEGVHDQAHRRLGRIDVLLLRNVFLQDVILDGAGDFFPVSALLFGDHQIHRPQHRGGRVDGHGNRGLLQVDGGEEDFHVLEGVDSYAALADLAFAGWMIGVVPHERGEIEGDRETASAMLEQILVALVGLFRRSEAGELTHGEKLAPISAGVNAARKWRLAREAKIVLMIPVFGKIGLGIETPYWNARNCGEASVPVVVEIHPTSLPDRMFGRFLQRGGENLFRPLLLGRGGTTSREDIIHWAF